MRSVKWALFMGEGNGSIDDRGPDRCADLVPKHDFIDVKFVFLTVIGTIIALYGIFGNVTTAAVMLRKSMRYSSYNLYLGSLAIFDTLLLLPSIMLYSMEPVSEYFDRPDMYVIWIQWVPHCFALSHFAQTGSVYITVSATFERCLAVLYPKHAEIQCNKQRAVLAVVGVTIFAAVFNCTKYFEIVVFHHENCTGFTAYELLPSALLRHPVYFVVYTLWLSQFVMVFLPFIILLATNTAIVWAFRRSLKQMKSWERKVSVKCLDGSQMILERAVLKEQSRDATRVLVIIVCVFLICNSLGFVVTVLESVYTSELLVKQWPKLYALARDAINFLAIISSAANFTICCAFGKDFRCEMAAMYGCTSYRKRLMSARRRRYFIRISRAARERFTLNGKRLVETIVETEPTGNSPQKVESAHTVDAFYRARNCKESMFAYILVEILRYAMNWRRWVVWFAMLMLELVLCPIFWLIRFSWTLIPWELDILDQVEAHFGTPTAVVLSLVIWLAIIVQGLLKTIREILQECDIIFVSSLITSILIQAVRNQFSNVATSPIRSTLRSVDTPFSNKTNGSRWFYQVTICNFSSLDDPFWPRASVVHIVEIRRHSLLWDEMIIWEVSTFNGTRHFVHNIHLPFGPLFYDIQSVACLQSNGLIGVFLQRVNGQTNCDLWYFYDTRTNRTATYKRDRFSHVVSSNTVYVSMYCEKRIWNADGSISGWRIRLISGYCDEVGVFEPTRRACLVNSVIDLCQNPRLISQEEVVSNASHWKLGVVRTSDGRFGLHSEWTNGGSAILHDRETNRYTCATIRKLRKTDRHFVTCFGGSVAPVQGAEEAEEDTSQEDEESNDEEEEESDSVEPSVSIIEIVSQWPTVSCQPFRPIVLSECECLKFLDNGTILRIIFEPPSLKYRAMQQLLLLDRRISSQMTAREFQIQTGLDSMQAHFEKSGMKKTYGILWPSIHVSLAPRIIV